MGVCVCVKKQTLRQSLRDTIRKGKMLTKRTRKTHTTQNKINSSRARVADALLLSDLYPYVLIIR